MNSKTFCFLLPFILNLSSKEREEKEKKKEIEGTEGVKRVGGYFPLLVNFKFPRISSCQSIKERKRKERKKEGEFIFKERGHLINYYFVPFSLAFSFDSDRQSNF